MTHQRGMSEDLDKVLQAPSPNLDSQLLRDHKNRFLAVLSFFLPLLLYLASLAPTVSWGDAAKLALQARDLDFSFSYDAHFLHTLILASLRSFPFLPFEIVANSFSALCSSLAALFLSKIPTEKEKVSPNRSLLLTLAFAFSHAVFFSSTITESYPLALSLLAASFYFHYEKLPLACFLGFLSTLAHPLALILLPYYALHGREKKNLGALLLFILPTLFFFFLGNALDPSSSFGLKRLSLWIFAFGRRVGFEDSPLFSFVKVAVLTPALFLYQFPLLWFVFVRAIRQNSYVSFLILLPLFLATAFYGTQRSFLFFSFVNFFYILLCARIPYTKKILLFSAPLQILLYILLPLFFFLSQIQIVPARYLPYRNNTVYFLSPMKRWDMGPKRYAEAVFDSLSAEDVLYTDFTPGVVLLYYQPRERALRMVFVDYPLSQLDPAQARQWIEQGKRVFISSLDLGLDYNIEELRKMCVLVPRGVVYECLPRAAKPRQH